MTPHLIMCHHFHGSGYVPEQGSFGADDLEAVIATYGDRIIPAREWQERALDGTLGAADVALSFDDGLQCQGDIALPVLQAHGLTAFWFICSAVLAGGIEPFELYRRFRNRYFATMSAFYSEFERAAGISVGVPAGYLAEYPFYSAADKRFRYMRDVALRDEYDAIMDKLMAEHEVTAAMLSRGLWMPAAQIAGLHAAGHVIGLHSHSHPTNLAALPAVRQALEYELCRSAVRVVTGERATCMAHPCNSYSATTLQVLHDMGIRLGFRSNQAARAMSLLELPRADIATIRRAA